MIKVEYHIKFPEGADVSEMAVHPEFVKLRELFQAIRSEAAKRNCAQFRDNKNEREFTMFYIWFDHQECADFVAWANETLDYENRYKEVEALIASHGGTITRNETIS
jgi:hypothetical protein